MKKSELSTIFLIILNIFLVGLVIWKLSKPKPQSIKTKEVIVLQLQEIEKHTSKQGTDTYYRLEGRRYNKRVVLNLILNDTVQIKQSNCLFFIE